MNLRRLLDELKPKLDPIFYDENFSNEVWFQMMIDVVENHVKHWRVKPQIESHELVLKFVKGKQNGKVI